MILGSREAVKGKFEGERWLKWCLEWERDGEQWVPQDEAAGDVVAMDCGKAANRLTKEVATRPVSGQNFWIRYYDQ